MEQQNQQKRQIAYKVNISNILNGKYIKKEGWEPNSIKFGEKEVSRVNIIAAIVSKSSQDGNNSSSLIDDGSGKVTVRCFENDILSNFNIGEIIMVIGRPREYNNERYIIPEIVKKINDPRWIEIRKIELGESKQTNEEKEAPEEEFEKVERFEDGLEKEDLLQEKIVQYITKEDSGSGADYQEIVDKIKGSEAEIERLLKAGEIFEIRPGKLKILE